MHIHINLRHEIGKRNPMLYGHFIEHFHRQIYDGVYDPKSPFADEDGLRTDVLEAMRNLRVPILRWPGGCFVSAYHWKDAVGSERQAYFDKAWRVEDPSTFGTDEYIKMCRKIGCEPYICTNAGSGTAEEMSDWVEYCNLETEGKFAKWRIKNGYEKPHNVKYWSVGNENYYDAEIGTKISGEWGKLVKESAKMIKHVDPTTELSAAALTDVKWDIDLLEQAGEFLDWISIHEYWDGLWQVNDYADYEQVMAYTYDIGHSINEIRGLLTALKLDKKIKIAFDEWNLRGWHHPNTQMVKQGVRKEDYLYPRDENDDNTKYTMADAVFTACFLNELNRNCDIVGMANYAPIVNTRGCIYTYPGGIVLRSTYYVYELYVKYMGDVVLNTWNEDVPQMQVKHKNGKELCIDTIDIVCTKWTDRAGLAVAAVNKDPKKEQKIVLPVKEVSGKVTMYTVSGNSTESYNDVGHEEVKVTKQDMGVYEYGMEVMLAPHSVNVIQIN